MNNTVKIRPHHLLDMLRDYGNKVVHHTHPFGASVKEVTNIVMSSTESFVMVPRVDSICETCSMLEDEICQAKIREDLLMSEYNDDLDDKLFQVMKLKPFMKLTLLDFTLIIDGMLDTILEQFTSPDNNKGLRYIGTKKAISDILYNN
ncbi:MAG: hypothetical protein OCD02_10330 [Spirochaetaceae bacterium]